MFPEETDATRNANGTGPAGLASVHYFFAASNPAGMASYRYLSLPSRIGQFLPRARVPRVVQLYSGRAAPG